MGFGAFISGFDSVDVLARFSGEGLGILLVGDGIYHAIARGERKSMIFDKGATIYALAEDIRSRGFSESEVQPGVQVISYQDLVDLIMKDYEKLGWF
jgi:sulfur relay protein TusB/DsrH